MADADIVLPAPAEFLAELLDFAEPPLMPDGNPGTRLDTLAVELPVELAIETADGGGLVLGLAPPTQTTLTSVFPVLHRLGLRVTVSNDG